jgi:Glycosyl hydrolase family 14
MPHRRLVAPLQCGKQDPDMWYTYQPPGRGPSGERNEECISLFADHVRCLRGRTPVECYRDHMHAFATSLSDVLGSVIVDVVVGMGPCGELRYPAYPEQQGWRFPGVGQFTVHDRRAKASLARAAADAGHPEWGNGPPAGVGAFNDAPQDTSFFTWGGGWQTPHGDFFLSWYASALEAHARTMLQAAVAAFFPFMGADAQATLAERGAAAVAGLPVEPPLRTASSDVAMDTLSSGAPDTGRGARCHDASSGAVTATDVSTVTTPNSSGLGLAAAAPGLAEPGQNGATTPDPDSGGVLWAERIALGAQPAAMPPLLETGVVGGPGDAGWPDDGDAAGGGSRAGVPLSARSSGSLRSLMSTRGPRVPLRLSVKIAGADSASQHAVCLRVLLLASCAKCCDMSIGDTSATRCPQVLDALLVPGLSCQCCTGAKPGAAVSFLQQLAH